MNAEWWRRVTCRLLGHQDIREFPHREVCERPWDAAHAAETAAAVDRICHYCDSDWLT